MTLVGPPLFIIHNYTCGQIFLQNQCKFLTDKSIHEVSITKANKKNEAFEKIFTYRVNRELEYDFANKRQLVKKVNNAAQKRPTF